MSADHATAPTPTRPHDPLSIESNAPADPVADAFDRADRYHAEIHSDDIDELRRELADTQAALDVATAALCRERPAPHPRALGNAMKHAYFRSSRVPTVGPDDRWSWAAETAIDMIRGLIPAPSVAEGGEGAAAAPAATGDPALGDTPVDDLARAMWERESYVRHTEWTVLRPHIRSFYLARARAALDHLTGRGWNAPAGNAEVGA